MPGRARRPCGAPPSSGPLSWGSTCAPLGRSNPRRSWRSRGSATFWRASRASSTPCRARRPARCGSPCCWSPPVTCRRTSARWGSLARGPPRARSQAPLLDDRRPQWLDGPSARALAFAVRRLEANQFAAARCAGRIAPVCPSIRIARCPRSSCSRFRHSTSTRPTLLLDRIDIVFPRPTVRSLHEVAGGNPFFVLELGRALAPELATRARDGAARRPCCTSLSVRASMRCRPIPERRWPPQQRSPSRRRRLSAPRRPTAGSRARARDRGWGYRVSRRPGPVRPSTTRRSCVPGVPVEPSARDPSGACRCRGPAGARPSPRARFAAPNAEIAAEIETAARQARARGAPVVAGELAEHAVRLTPPDRDRRCEAAGCGRRILALRGRGHPSGTLPLEDVLVGSDPGAERTRLLLRLARIRSYDDDIRAARA